MKNAGTNNKSPNKIEGRIYSAVPPTLILKKTIEHHPVILLPTALFASSPVMSACLFHDPLQSDNGRFREKINLQSWGVYPGRRNDSHPSIVSLHLSSRFLPNHSFSKIYFIFKENAHFRSFYLIRSGISTLRQPIVENTAKTYCPK